MFKSAVVSLLFLSSTSAAQSRGPIELPPVYALTDPRLGLTPTTAKTLTDDDQKILFSLAWANTSVFHRPEVDKSSPDGPRLVPCLDSDAKCYTVDTETRQFLTTYKAGLGEGSEVGITVPIIWRGGGIMDSTIDAWHRAFGFRRGGRNLVDDDESTITGKTDSGTFEFDDGWALGNISTNYKYEVASSESTITSLLPEISLPTSRSSFGHQGLDAGLSILNQQTFSIGFLHTGAGIFAASDREISGVKYRPVHAEGFIDFEYPYSQSLALLAGLNGSTQMITNIPDHPDYAVYLDTGAKIQIANSELSLLLRENPTPRSGSTDFLMLAAISWIF